MVKYCVFRTRPSTYSTCMSMVHVHKTFKVFILDCRVTLQVEGLVIKRSVTEVLMEMSCLDIQCDKHQVFHIQVSCIVHTIPGNLPSNCRCKLNLIPKYIYGRCLPLYCYIFAILLKDDIENVQLILLFFNFVCKTYW